MSDRPESLNRRLSDPVSDPAVRPSAAPAGPSEPLLRGAFNTDGRARLLLADDEPLGRRQLATTTAGWGYDVTTVADGKDALASLLRRDAPRLAVLDWDMPGLSGVDVCRMLRGRADTNYVYVILLTAREGRRQLIDALTSGADDFINKPFDPKELEMRLRAGRRIVQLQDQLLDAQAALERQALYDALTGIKNRRALTETLQQELAKVRRRGGVLSVVLSDIDHFKHVNDTYGHAAGDEVLKAFASRGQKETRQYDSLGRHGGEEFLLIAPDCTLDQAAVIAERLRAAVAESPVETGEGRIAITASFGVASTEQGYVTDAPLLSAADDALYAAKHGGRNRICLAKTAANAPTAAPPATSSSERSPRSSPRPRDETPGARSGRARSCR